MRLTILVASALAVALAASGSAAHCSDYSTSEPEIDTGESIGGRFYVDNDLCQPECVFSIWSYQESNGIPGLQRSDEVVDDTCHWMIEGDVISPY